jgi:hypothetical protein
MVWTGSEMADYPNDYGNGSTTLINWIKRVAEPPIVE